MMWVVEVKRMMILNLEFEVMCVIEINCCCMDMCPLFKRGTVNLF